MKIPNREKKLVKEYNRFQINWYRSLEINDRILLEGIIFTDFSDYVCKYFFIPRVKIQINPIILKKRHKIKDKNYSVTGDYNDKNKTITLESQHLIWFLHELSHHIQAEGKFRCGKYGHGKSFIDCEGIIFEMAINYIRSNNMGS